MGIVLLVDRPVGSPRLRPFFTAEHSLIETSGGADALVAVEGSRIDVAVVDVSPPADDGWRFIARARALQPELALIVAATEFDLGSARRALAAGALDLFAFDAADAAAQMQTAVERAVEAAALRHRADAVSARIAHHRRYREELLGASPAIAAVRDAVRRYAGAGAAILVQGPTGAGKEVVAKALHESSRFAGGPFIPVDLPTLVPELLVAELFGHVRGAYTGAPGGMGAFEAADGGTLFLDEIGELALEQQAKLLRAIETREIQRVGSTRRVLLDLQIVAATNRDLRQMVERGAFRQDLFYRLRELQLSVPALSARRSDIPAFVEHFLKAALRKLGRDRPAAVDPGAMELLCRHSWPGNVRELRSFMEAVVLCCEDARITRDLVAARLSPDVTELADLPLRQRLAAYERRSLEEVLSAAGGNLRHGARLAGEPFSTFHSRLRRHGLASRPASLVGGSSRTRILLIESDPGTRRRLASTLRASYDLTLARDGREALSTLASRRDFDLILCELVMPPPDGLEVLAQFRARHPSLAPRFALLAEPGALADLARRAAVDARVLPKPLDVEELRALITALREPGARRERAAD